MSSAPPSPTDSSRAADAVVRNIEQEIRTGALKDGVMLPPERDLGARYGVSRTVVREAMRILSSRGLVETRPRHRPIVRTPGIETALDVMEAIVPHMLAQPGGVRNLFDTRILIEAGLVREAARKATKPDIDALGAALALNAEAVDDSEAFYRTDGSFHRVLYEIPKNPALKALHQAYTVWLAPHWSQMPRSAPRNRHNHAAHTRIYEAILHRDPDAAEAALRQHLDDAWAQVCATFGEV